MPPALVLENLCNHPGDLIQGDSCFSSGVLYNSPDRVCSTQKQIGYGKHCQLQKTPD